eukprot:CAMPEP_0116831444 /NCGR_PEP_ID=MMETSP0418-20121206/5340_1 /TAXON_ID=1158023 /ORGANISM="Astrosyne radiata, Strain 13vi08-1A" /LENGTH=139 /DNA_ID=CAMNT_0004460695 /DNA_START=9 /DNA_END=428 /DNA_ORIENTATION=-
MKVLFVFLAALAVAAAFAPAASVKKSGVTLNAMMDRKAFLTAAVSAFGVAGAAGVAKAMDQENVADPSEIWVTGKPDAEAAADRKARYTNARTQLTSNFAPIKRLTMERKSPQARIDLISPDFKTYHKTYPGLYKTVQK